MDNKQFNNNVIANNDSDSKTLEAINTMSDSELNEIVIANLKGLISKYNISQKDLANQIHYSEAAISKYFNGKQYPTIDFLFRLKKLYHISIDDFVSRKIVEPPQTPEDVTRQLQEIAELELYKKYCGNFLVYYLDTSNYKGRDYNDPAESLVYGVVNIHEVNTNLGKSEFESFAILGISNRDTATQLKENLDSFSKIEDITEFIYSSENKDLHNNIYEGDFEFGVEHAYITLKHGNIDKALIVLYRVLTNKDKYIGGLGVINSGSKGRERMPTAQFMAFSRYPLSLSAEEIHHQLLLTYPNFKADDETKELIALFKHYYLYNDAQNDPLSDYQKELIIKVNIETCMKNIITRNMDRYAKVSERDDSSWYQVLKNEQKKVNNPIK